MALSKATRLSDFATGIGTAGSALKIDNANQRVGIGTTNPQAMLQVGQNITMDGGASGVITATSFEGSGANLTGVSGFGTALNATQNTIGNLTYKTPRHFYIGTGTTVYLRSDATSGNMLFTRLGDIQVGSGATLQIGTGTTMIMDVLSLF